MRILYVLILITLHTFILSKKLRHFSTSDDSIENLLFYKDCSRKGNNNDSPNQVLHFHPTDAPTPRPTPSQCPCPRVCCSLCCECGNFQTQTSIMSQQIQTLQPAPQPSQVMAQNVPPQPPRRKKSKQILQPPIGGRRDMTTTREHIKGLIAQDEDIKKILKDLVRVTMQKVDVIETIKARKAGQQEPIKKKQTDDDKAVEVANASEEDNE